MNGGNGGTMAKQSHWLAAFVPLFFCLGLPGTAEEEPRQSDPLRQEALAGEVDSQLKLASEFFFGTETRPRNPVLAVYWYRKAAEQGSGEGAYNLGVCYEKGWGVDRSSLIRAFEWFDQAAKAGIPEAKLRLGLLLAAGVPDEHLEKEVLKGISADRVAAFRMLRELAQTGYLPAAREFGKLVLADRADRETSGKEARKLLQMAAETGDVESMLLLAVCYRDAIGGSGDQAKAVECWERAAGLGSSEAKVYLAAACEYGQGIKCDPDRAFALVKEAAAAADPRALLRLGDYYLNGDHVESSLSEALALYRRSYESGYLPAAVRLGRCAELGLGMTADPVRAAELYGIAARAGDPDAQYAFGRCHLKGIGMEPDPAGAVFWFKTATASGQLDAVRELGICLLTGNGVEKDTEEGSRLLEAAAASGDAEALVFLNNN